MSGLDPTFLTSGLVLVVLGAVLAYARSVPVTIYRHLQSTIVLSVEVTQADEAFGWLVTWLDRQPSVKRSKRLAIQVRRPDGNEPEVTYTPLGFHVLRYGGRFVWFMRTREHQKSDGVFVGLWETITLSTFARQRGLLEALLTEARQDHESSRKGKVCIWSLDQWGNWVEIARKQPRSLASVVLSHTTPERTLADVQRFLDRRDWYSSIGVPYRRGFLLHGPPGNGKTSLVFAIASELRRDLAVVSLAAPTLTDDLLRDGLARLPANAILLIEDIDGVFNQRTPARPDMKLTFSGLLNALDGVATSDGRIMFVTTNHIDRLDPALIRPGRIDVHIEIGQPDREQIVRLYQRFFGERAFDSGSDGLSMAAYQERFIELANSEDALP